MASSTLTGKVEADVEIKASAEQFHDMFANKLHHVHHTCNDKVRGCDLHEGEWGNVGTVFEFHYTHDGKDKVAKEVVEAVDPDKNLIVFRVIDGDLMKEYKSFLLTLQAFPKSEGSGSIVHWKMEYEKLHDGIDHPETLLQLGLDISKDIDAHLTQAK
ncbi:MLP-like protein 28 [Hibiscus trionum]|uniref:MLP-like protein 28 n=1 Tax=Hibiscus trionum TaxID=183268 RepID=A0A9W7JF03_HIBTR|nr:MLP-like protein 28 [Hibiscus trionum]